MFGNLRKRFHAVKFLYTINLQSISPWFMHKRPVEIVWRRGNKRNRTGTVPLKYPTKSSVNDVAAILNIDESFELDVTLYSASNRTRKTGPYGLKELRLLIMQVEDDNSLHSVIGAVTIKLNEIVGLVSHELQLPLECDQEIIEAVGQPIFYLNIRSYYRHGSGASSISSGITSTGWSRGDFSSEMEDVDDSQDEHHDLEPVRLMDDTNNELSYKSWKNSMDSVPENTSMKGEVSVPIEDEIEIDQQSEEVDRKVTEAQTEIDESVVSLQNQSEETEAIRRDQLVLPSEDDGTIVFASAVLPEETKPIEEAEAVTVVRQDKDGDPDKQLSGGVLQNQSIADKEAFSQPILVNSQLYQRLSTIKSEGGEDNDEEVDEAQIISELHDTLGNIKETREDKNPVEDDISTEISLNLDNQLELLQASQDETSLDQPQEEEEVQIKSNELIEEAIAANEKKTEIDVSKGLTSFPISASQPNTDDEVTTPKLGNSKSIEKIKKVTESTEVRVSGRVPHETRKEGNEDSFAATPLWLRYLLCLPGGRLVCCQPVLPREP